MNLFNATKKYNGFASLKNYAKNHVLIYALVQILILKKDITGLELFRECMNKKIYDKISKKFSKTLNDFSYSKNEIHHGMNKIVWLCWLQGMEYAPPLVQKCYESVKRNFADYKINLLTSDNFSAHVEMPEFIIEKWKKGIISNTHFSDILRIYLLEQHGGLWIDATVFITGKLPKDIEQSDFFVFQCLKPGKDGKAIFISSWFIRSTANHPIIKYTRILLERYWEKYNSLCDYFLLHIFMCMVLSKFPEFYAKIPKYTNSTPHTLFFNLFEKFDAEQFKAICEQTPIHKLSYKAISEDKIFGSFYEKVVLMGGDKSGNVDY